MTAPIDIECPSCKSGAGDYCKSETTRPGVYMCVTFHHAERVDAAARDTDRVRQDSPVRLREALRQVITLLKWHATRADESADLRLVADLCKEFDL